MSWLKKSLVSGAIVAVCLMNIDFVQGYLVEYSLSLDQLAESADLIVKAEVISNKPVEDAWFEPTAPYAPHATVLKIIATYRGDAPEKEIAFHHFGPVRKQAVYIEAAQQHYEFVVGKTYIICAKATDNKLVFRQLWKNHRSQEDQGVLLAANQEPHSDLSLAQVYWIELTGLLQSKSEGDVLYALQHLDTLSVSEHNQKEKPAPDFERSEVLSAVMPLLRHEMLAVARQVLAILGCRNPYQSTDFMPGWLATIGKGDIQGFGTWDVSAENLGGKTYWKELSAVANESPNPEIRSLAIRALGRAAVPESFPALESWLADPEPLVRSSAALLLADFPQEANLNQLKRLTTDPEALPRQGAAAAIGLGQFRTLIPELGKLLADPEPKVAQAAALSLLSFSLDDSRPTLKAQLRHADYQVLFVNALAKEDRQTYLPDLCDNIRQNRLPKHWWGGRTPWGVSWELLLDYVQDQPAEKLQTGKFDLILDALEFPGTAPAKGPTYYSSSEPRDLYAFYVQRKMPQRASKFRAMLKQNTSYDIDYYFKMVDENPAQYGKK